MEKIYKRFVNITESKVIEKHNINHKCGIKPEGNFYRYQCKRERERYSCRRLL